MEYWQEVLIKRDLKKRLDSGEFLHWYGLTTAEREAYLRMVILYN